jgi:hypothetical protein
LLEARTRFDLIPNLMQDNLRLHHLEQHEGLVIATNPKFSKENIFFFFFFNLNNNSLIKNKQNMEPLIEFPVPGNTNLNELLN